MTPPTIRHVSALIALLVVIVVPRDAATAPQAAAHLDNAAGSAPIERLELLVGRSVVVRSDRPILRVSVPSPDVADALVTSAHEVLVHGKAPGTISLLVWAEGNHIRTYDVSVRRDLAGLEERVRQLFPGEPITVTGNGTDVVLSGIVSSKFVVDKAVTLATGYVEKADRVVNLLRQQDRAGVDQVLLQVRFAEVSRSALQELGVSFFTGALGHKDWIGRSTTQQFPAPEFDNDKGLVFSDFLNILAFNTKEQLGALIKALQTRGLFQSLAEPNLIARDGQEASFLAGGEYPYPVVQGGGGAGTAVTIMFKEFGVRLKFTPTVVGNDLVQLKVAPEVSALDFGNAVTVDGFRIPALTTRRTETAVELRDGQTFAIAGLLDNTVTQTMSKMPGLGDIPILGLLFKSRAYQKNTTELVVMITPHIVRRDSPGVTTTVPNLVEPFLPPPVKVLPPPPPAFPQLKLPKASAPPDAASARAPKKEERQSAPGSPAHDTDTTRGAATREPQRQESLRPEKTPTPSDEHRETVDEEEAERQAKRQAELEAMLARSLSRGPVRRWTRF